MKAKPSTLAALVIAVCAVQTTGAGQTADGFTPLFNGRDFTGWKVPAGDNGHWRIVDGAIDYDAESEAESKDLWTERPYRDFTLQVDWRITSEAVFFCKFNQSAHRLFIRLSIQRHFYFCPPS